jgi:hypothetical protein
VADIRQVAGIATYSLQNLSRGQYVVQVKNDAIHESRRIVVP